jgi:penicillin-binding protein 1A
MRSETAYVRVDVMKGVIERGTGAKAKVLGRPLAGKTGTTDDATDLWFVGFSPRLVAGVWLGYDIKRSLGSAETGGRLALPIWITFMQKALAGTEPEDFPEPENVASLRTSPRNGRPAPPEDRDSGTVQESVTKAPESKGAQAATERFKPAEAPLPSGAPPLPASAVPITPLPPTASDR